MSSSLVRAGFKGEAEELALDIMPMWIVDKERG